MNELLAFIAGCFATALCFTWRNAIRARRARRKIARYLTPRLLSENAQRFAEFSLPDSFWRNN